MDLLAISVGNTRTKWARCDSGGVEASGAIDNADLVAQPRVGAEVLAQSGSDPDSVACVLASVNDPVADRIGAGLSPLLARGVLRVRRDLEIPIRHALRDDTTVGTDRLLNALAAYRKSKQACVIVDAGTAITVDFVDGQGVYHGGAIAPGLDMMLRALHEHTAALPSLRYEHPILDEGQGPFGRDTKAAMLQGVRSAGIGMTRYLVEQYAEYYGGYPIVIATGGNARLLFDADEVVEHIVPELTLLGIHECWRSALEREGDDESTQIDSGKDDAEDDA
jgi:type III pantothenate kinase